MKVFISIFGNLGFVHLLGLSENHISKSQFQKNVLCRHFLLWDRTC